MKSIVLYARLTNEFYAKDTSRKVRAVTRAKAERGERVSTRPSYGYRKSDSDPRKIVPDEEAAQVVRRIFQLCAAGRGPSQIARQLKQEKVLNPNNYYFQKHGVALTALDTTRPYAWSDTTIGKMLEDEIYLGHTISLRYTSPSYKNKKRIERPKSEWLRFENTHEPIISQDLWDIVQEVRKHKHRPPKMLDEPNLFSGLVYCADCGAPMRLFRTRTRTADSYSNYKCGAYSKRGKEACSGHYIRESQLKAIVLDDLRRVTYYARQKEKLLLQYVAQKNTAQVKKEIGQIQKETGRLHRRDIELTALFKRLYEDNVLQRIPDEQYRILSTEYTQEQAELRERLTQLETRQKKLAASATNTARFVERAKQYSEITELTPELLRLFIERIEVGERAVKYSRNAVQDVMIYYRDIGLLDTTEAKDLKDQQAETDPAA